MSKHEMTRRRGGKEELSWIQPVCACGFEGHKHYAYNDFQFTMLKSEENEYIVEMHRKTD